MSDLRQKLIDDVLSAAPWDALREHGQNLLIVTGIPIVDAGLALAEDDVTKVEEWLSNGNLTKPTAEQFEAWNADEPTFVALIVQPWILLQLD